LGRHRLPLLEKLTAQTSFITTHNFKPLLHRSTNYYPPNPAAGARHFKG
jgi:hypothetical protein